MTCFKPLDAYRGRNGQIVFSKANSIMGQYLQIPCGRCNGCRITKSRAWAIRCIHEASANGDKNSFITLTYNDDHLPKDASLKHLHFQKFIRALRKRTGEKIRYYMCGEYGRPTEENNHVARPHFHAILFGYAFPDKRLHKKRRNNLVYRSEILEKTWVHGFSEIGNVTFKSCAYVARYIIKKQKEETGHYAIFSPITGEISGYRQPEYTKMSLKPGIGSDYYEKNIMDIFPGDFVMLEGGKKLEVPKYYKEKLKKDHPILAELLRKSRVKQAKESKHNTPERLAVREQIQSLKLVRLKRDI